MATIIQRPDALSLVGNLKKIILASGSPISFELKKGGASIFSGVYTPSSDGSVVIDLREIIESTLSFVWSSSADPYINSGISSQFSAVIDGVTTTFIVVNSGVSYLADTPSNFLTQNFLTWQPQSKQVTYYTPEFLSYYATIPGIAKLKAYFQSGGVTTDTTITFATLVSGSAYTFPMQYGNIVGKLSNRLPSFYDVWIENQQGARLSYVQRYVASSALSEQEQWILFTNSLGGLDTFRAYGSSELEADHTHNIAVIDDISSEYKVDTERKFNKNTGYLDQYSRKWLLDFFPSLSKYIYEGSSIRQIVVLESDVSYKDQDLPSSYTFTYKYADARPYLNLSRSEQLSSDLNISIPDLGSFTLPPRLAEVSRLPLSEGALFPVQSPYSEQWATTTAGALLSYIARELSSYSGAEGGGVGHTHSNLDLLQLLSIVDGYLKFNGTKIKASLADVASVSNIADDLAGGGTGAIKYARKDITQTIAQVYTFTKGIVASALSYFDYGIQVVGGVVSDTIEAINSFKIGNATFTNPLGTVNIDKSVNITGDVTASGKSKAKDIEGTGSVKVGAATMTNSGGKTTITEDFEADNLKASESLDTPLAKIHNKAITGILVSGHYVDGKWEELFTSDYFLGSGYKMWMENGMSNLEIDKLFVRHEAIFNKLTIAEIKSIGGQILETVANMTCSLVEVNGEYYRCFYETDPDEEGNSTVFNGFLVGDQAICQTFNGKGAKYYWRLIIAVGDGYIDLSTTDADGLGVPAMGDEIIQLGNRTNPDRQNAILISAYGADAPSIKQYAGINSFSLVDKEMTVISPKGNKFIAESFTIKVGDTSSKVLSEDEVGGQISFAVNETRTYTDTMVTYRVEVISSNGSAFRNDNINTTLTAKVFKGNCDVTSTLSQSCFRWFRSSSNTADDALWNQRYSMFNSNVLNITSDDVEGRAVFNCEVNIPN